MTLQDNLFTIIGKEENNFDLSLNSDCIIYKAHFPEQPITPGVCIIRIATELLQRLLDKKLCLTEVVNAKFLAVINPTVFETVRYTFSKMAIDESCSTAKVSVTVTSGTTVCSKLSLLYHIDE